MANELNALYHAEDLNTTDSFQGEGTLGFPTVYTRWRKTDGWLITPLFYTAVSVIAVPGCPENRSFSRVCVRYENIMFEYTACRNDPCRNLRGTLCWPGVGQRIQRSHVQNQRSRITYPLNQTHDATSPSRTIPIRCPPHCPRSVRNVSLTPSPAEYPLALCPIR